MTDRSIFNRRYTEFRSDGTDVYLVNGAGNSTGGGGGDSTRDFIAGENLVQGAAVYVSGVNVYNASAASGIQYFNWNAIGITTQAAAATESVPVNLDSVVTLSDLNITAESALEPGEYYYLSSSPGQVTRYSTASGEVSAPSGYAALVNLGTAISTSELSLEIQPLVELYGFGSTGPIPEPTSFQFVAGQDLIQGDIVFVSGTSVFPANAASGVPVTHYEPIGFTAGSATQGSTVNVIFDDVVQLADANISAETELVPGQYYYLSKSEGQVVRYDTASGVITAAEGYAALVNVGQALSVNAFHAQLQQSVELFT